MPRGDPKPPRSLRADARIAVATVIWRDGITAGFSARGIENFAKMFQFAIGKRKSSSEFREKKLQKRFVKRLKLEATPQEIMLHGALLKAFQPYRVSVMFQQPVGPYVADFFLSPLGVVIEVDGKIHEQPEVAARDRRRNTFMRNRGLRVMRFTNAEVAANPNAVAEGIVADLGELPRRGDPVEITKCPPGSAVHGKPPLKRKSGFKRVS